MGNNRNCKTTFSPVLVWIGTTVTTVNYVIFHFPFLFKKSPDQFQLVDGLSWVECALFSGGLAQIISILGGLGSRAVSTVRTVS